MTTESEWRIDPLTGREAVIVGSRQGRPNLPSSGCPFCPGGLEAPDPYDVRWFVNRWPALDADRCEVVLYSPRHDAALWELGVEGVTRVVRLWADRTSALGARPDVAYVLPFENRGPEVGATIAHPHGQIYAFNTVPPEPAGELARAEAVPDGTGRGADPDLSGELTVATHGRWRVAVPSAATWPYECRITHLDGVGSLVDDGADHEGLAACLVDTVHRYDRLFEEPMPYMLWVHQRPTDGRDWPGAVAHVHLAPIHRRAGTPRYVAAGELGSGVFFNPVVPEDAAAALRAAAEGLPGSAPLTERSPAEPGTPA